MTKLFQLARTALVDLAAAEGREVGEFATTLAVAVVSSSRIDIGQVGDSVVVIRTQDGEFSSVQPQKRYEYANETDFLTGAGFPGVLREAQFPSEDVSGIAMSTDGLRLKILGNVATGEPYAPFFEDVFAYAAHPDSISEAVGAFISAVDDQTGDDKTLVVAVPGTPTEPRSIGREPKRPMLAGGEPQEA